MDRTQLPIQLPTPDVEPAFDISSQQPPFPRPERVTAPTGAPNVLVILIDDMGFGTSSPFGGPCTMPTAEQLAADGLRFNRFHTTAICSPTRAALLTGRNHHSVGMGMVPEVATSSPGYTSIRPIDAAPLARILRDNGYATGAFGKWHQTPSHEITPVGPYTHWPTNEGFDKFYGFVSALEDQFYPVLHDGTTPIEPPATPGEGYHLSEDLVEQARDWIRQVRTVDAHKPWFSYLAFGATHSPFQVPDSWLDRYRGRFSHGWNAQREQTIARQKELGIIPAETMLTQWNGEIPEWDDLTDTERVVAERLMEIYASFAEHTDAQVGRLIDALRESGELDNTIVFYILGDNGASPEGRLVGTFNEHRTFNGLPETAEEIAERLDEIGTKTSYANYPVGWALAMDTPFQWTKQVASHLGGTRNGLIVHWPAGIADRGVIRDHWHHVIDVAPTVLEAAGIPQPTHVDGIAQRPIEGSSMLAALRDADSAETHTTQYFEIFGNRGIYHEGWTAVARHRIPWLWVGHDNLPYDQDVWELYDIRSDFSQAVDLADQHPEKLAELQELFLAEARKHQVLPLDDRAMGRTGQSPFGSPQPTEVRLPARTRHLPARTVPALVGRSFSIRVELESDGADDGVLISQGDSLNGWSLYVVDGRPVFVNNVATAAWDEIRSPEPLPTGRSTVELHFDFDPAHPAYGGAARLGIDGKQVAGQPFGRLAVGGARITVGANPGTPVGRDYARGGEFAFSGAIHEVVITGHDQAPQRTVADELEDALKTH